MTRLKILHAPTTVGGNSYYLSKAEKEHGLDSQSLTLSQNKYDFPCDICVLKGNENIILAEIKTIISAFKSLFTYNVFHFNFGRGILSMRPYPNKEGFSKWKIFLYTHVYTRFTELLDLKLAHKMGKVTAVTYNGTDARLYEYCKTNFPIHFVHEIENSAYSEKADSYKKQRFAIMEKYADIIYSVNPDLMHYLPKKTRFLPYTNIDPYEYSPIYSNSDEPIHIVHAPTNRPIKGTRYIIDAVDRLKNDGIKIKFTLIENMTNEEAKKIYQSADILIDQLLAGFYGGLAVECMALGKPVICYMRNEDLKFMPPKMVAELPIIKAQPDTIYAVLKKILEENKNYLHEVGKKSRQYVLDWHDPKKIALSVIEDYQKVMKEKSKKSK